MDWYRFDACAPCRRGLRAAGGLTFHVPNSTALLDEADTIIIPGWSDPFAPPPAKLLAALRRAHARGARLCSICSGVFLLAATGLLDGRRATTHWKYAGELAKHYPAIDVLPDALYVDEGQLITSAGSAAGLDMMLHVVRSDFGTRVANTVARRVVIPPHRDGGQAQFIQRPVQRQEEKRLAKLMERIRRKPANHYTLASMSTIAAMTTRTLQRQFRSRTGMTPIERVVQERITLAKELLETTGFGSEESLRRHFRHIVGVALMAYRERFSKPA